MYVASISARPVNEIRVKREAGAKPVKPQLIYKEEAARPLHRLLGDNAHCCLKGWTHATMDVGGLACHDRDLARLPVRKNANRHLEPQKFSTCEKDNTFTPLLISINRISTRL